MVEIGLVLILYILPSLIVGLAVYFDEEIQTIGDFVKYLWAVLIPFVNIFMVGVLLVNFIADFLQKKIKLDNFWEKIKNTKIKNKISKNILPTYTLDINIESPKQETLEEVVERLYPLDNNIESPKQETLEEVVERLYPYEIGYGVYNRNCEIDLERIAFDKGAEWQKEKQDDFAIGFVVWCDNLNIGEWSDKTTKELLEIYKKIKEITH